MLFPLEIHRRRRVSTSPVDDLSQILTSEEQASIRPVDAEAPDAESRLEEFRRQATQLIRGSQQEDLDDLYLIDCLREMSGRDRTWGTTTPPDSEDAERIRRIKEALAWAADSKGSLRIPQDDDNFRVRLREHAAGFLAPLVRQVVVDWDAPVLRAGITLVDLPGLGASGDSFKTITRDWIRKAQAIILVVDRSGIDQESAELLYQSEFLQRLIHSAHDPKADPVRLFVAVTHIDSVADKRNFDDKNKRKSAHFADVQKEMCDLVRSQLAKELSKVWRDGDDKMTQAEKRVSERLLDELRVFPLSAVQYRKILADDPDDRSFLATPEASGVPALEAALIEVVNKQRAENQRLFAGRCEVFRQRIRAELESFRPTSSDESFDEAVRQRAELLEEIRKRQPEFHRRQGALRQLWTATVPELIKSEVEKVRRCAESRMRRFLEALAARDVRVNVLQAVVRRGGRFVGSRDIDLPRDLGMGFDAEVAEVWNTHILPHLRTETVHFAEDCARLIEEVVAWAELQELTGVIPPLKVVAEATRAEADLLSIIGAEQMAHLRESVRDQLLRTIEKPIAEQCRTFNVEGLTDGSGAKKRILDLFHQLATEVADLSQGLAINLLQHSVSHAHEQVRAISQRLDPLKAAEQIANRQLTTNEPSAEDLRRREVWKQLEPLWLKLQN